MKTYDELVSLFEEANLAFLQGEHSLFRTEVAERTLCGVLMLHIHDIIKEDDRRLLVVVGDGCTVGCFGH